MKYAVQVKFSNGSIQTRRVHANSVKGARRFVEQFGLVFISAIEVR